MNKPVVFISSALMSDDYEARVFEYFTIIAAYLSIQMSMKGYDLVLKVPYHPGKLAQDQVEFIKMTRENLESYAGVIISPIDKAELTKGIGELILAAEKYNKRVKKCERIPVMTIDKGFENDDFTDLVAVREGNLSPGYVMCDEEEGGKLAAQAMFSHFFHQGGASQRSPVVAIVRGLEGSEHRVKGFTEQMVDLANRQGFKITISPRDIQGRFRRSVAKVEAVKCLNDPQKTLGVDRVDGFFCCNDEMALGIRDVLMENKLRLSQKLDTLRADRKSTTREEFSRQEHRLLSERSAIEKIKIIGFDGIRETQILIGEKDPWLLNSIDVNVGLQVERLANLFFSERGDVPLSVDPSFQPDSERPARTRHKEKPRLVNENYQQFRVSV
jgi:ABC-type sugar transport system substrate-binding protein